MYRLITYCSTLIISCFLAIGSVDAQGLSEKEIKAKWIGADELFETHNYLKALDPYYELLKIDNLNTKLNYRIGVCLFNLPVDKKKSLVYFERVKIGTPRGMYSSIEVISSEEIECYYYLGRIYHVMKRYEDAIKMYQFYKNYTGFKLSTSVTAQKEFSNAEIDRFIDISVYAERRIYKPEEIVVENLGKTINSEFPDYAPIISADETELIFTSRRKGTGGLKDLYGAYFEDIYTSTLVEGKWTAPVGMGDNVNTDTHDAGVSLSVDGNTLFIYRTNKELTGGDLYFLSLVEDKWSKPDKLTSLVTSLSINDEGINTNYIEPSATMSADGKTLYFSSNRPGGYGGKDIYRCIKLPDEQWSLAVNLGPTINTEYDEDAPFIHPDGRSLYFSSKGHDNMGGYDIFKTTLDQSDPLVQGFVLWSEPKNLGSPINSVADDIYFVLSATGSIGYFSSNREESIGYGSDIYKADMPAASRVMIVIKGVVTGIDSKEPVRARITVIDQENNRLHGLYKSHDFNGKYIMALEPKRKYKMIVEAEGFHTHTDEFFMISHIDSFAILQKDIKLVKIPVEEKDTTTEYVYTYTLEKVYFEQKKHELLESSYEAFTTLIRAMIANPTMEIEIAGHTDDVGEGKDNFLLSQKRAEAVREYLISRGIDEIRLKAKGYGEDWPVTTNETEMGRASNRRTDIRVLHE